MEDLVYDCQQCVEKSLKAICILRDISFPFTHNIGTLIQILKENDEDLFDNTEDALILTDYAVQTRYPGYYIPIQLDEYEEALDIANLVFDWADDIVSSFIDK